MLKSPAVMLTVEAIVYTAQILLASYDYTGGEQLARQFHNYPDPPLRLVAPPLETRWCVGDWLHLGDEESEPHLRRLVLLARAPEE